MQQGNLTDLVTVKGVRYNHIPHIWRNGEEMACRLIALGGLIKDNCTKYNVARTVSF